MHSKICDATANLINKRGVGVEVQPSETDKYLLMKRNMTLEREVAGRQKQSENAGVYVAL